MSTRSFMSMRTSVERSSHVSDTGGGYTDSWEPQTSDLPCRAWAYVSSQQYGQEVLNTAGTKAINVRIVIVPRSTDVRVGDRLPSVVSKKGVVLFTGPLIVDGVNERLDHLELATRKVV